MSNGDDVLDASPDDFADLDFEDMDAEIGKEQFALVDTLSDEQVMQLAAKVDGIVEGAERRAQVLGIVRFVMRAGLRFAAPV